MSMQQPNTFRGGPDERGHFGMFGGRFVAETLMPLILELEAAYARAKSDPAFQAEMNGYLEHYVGRPSPLYFAERMSEHLGGAKIYFKREDLNHTGAHKVNNVLGQILLARRMGKQRIIAETGAGMHGVATATLCAKFGFPCIVYMGAVDVERQQTNVLRMRALGAEVRPVVLHGNRTYLLMDDDGQIQEAHSISAGLDYPGIGPEHAWLHEVERVTYLSATDEEALAAFELCSKLEGIIPALEPAHALARVMDLAPRKPKDHLMVLNLSGRGDKDLASVADYLQRRRA